MWNTPMSFQSLQLNDSYHIEKMIMQSTLNQMPQTHSQQNIPYFPQRDRIPQRMGKRKPREMFYQRIEVTFHIVNVPY